MQLVPPTLHPVTRILTSTPLLFSTTSDPTCLWSPIYITRTVSKRLRISVLDPDPFKRLQLHTGFDTGDTAQHHDPTGAITLNLVTRRQGRISQFGSFPILLDPDSWLVPSIWKPFLDSPIQDGSGKSPKLLSTPVRSSCI